MARVLFLFFDGVGIGPADPEVNPFFRASLPTLSETLGGRLPSLDDSEPGGGVGQAFPLDACLGVDGTPQSGTGQIALLTGRNAPQMFGGHFGPWPPVRLREYLDRENFLSLSSKVGADIAFANAYPRGYPGARDSKRVSAVSLAARAAGVLNRDHEALSTESAVASEIVNDGWIRHLGHTNLPIVTPEEAGGNLSRIVGQADLTMYAHYHTDEAGHRGGMSGAVAALERVDRFLAGVLDELPRDTLLLAASDHGNIEDVRAGHTRNPALGLSLGTRAREIDRPHDLTQISRLILAEVSR